MPETRYIVRGKLAKDDPGSNYLRKGMDVFLTYSDDWFQWGNGLGAACPFEDRQEALDEAASCPGPWYLMPDKASIEAIEIEYVPARAASFKIKQQ